jgi:hypothetical protein
MLDDSEVIKARRVYVSTVLSQGANDVWPVLGDLRTGQGLTARGRIR